MMKRYTGIFRLLRPLNSLMAASYTLLGAYLGNDLSALLSLKVFIAALVVTFIVSYSFVINDYHDVVVDSLSKPQRPIPSGHISRRTAGIIAVILIIGALSMAFTLGPLLTVIALFNITLSTLYSYYLKSTVLLGNAIIAFLTASIVIYGNLAVDGNVLTHATWIISVLTFLYIFAQEILYTVRDYEGDMKCGIHTAATYYGTFVTINLFSLFAMAFVVTALLLWFLGLTSNYYLYALVPCCVLPIVTIVCLLSRSGTSRNILLAQYIIMTVRVFSLLPAILLKK